MSLVNQIPSILNLDEFHSMFKRGTYLIGDFHLLPSHMALVFPAFKKRPNFFPNISMIFIVLSNEFLSPSNIISISSAYCEILCSVSPMEIPLIFLSSQIIVASISTNNINKYGDIGSPCLQPLWIKNHCDNCPLTATVDFIPLQNVDIH